MMNKSINSLTVDEIRSRSSIGIEVVKDKDALAQTFASAVIGFVKEQNAQSKPSVIIMPVGPTGQWKLMVDIAIAENIDLTGLHIVSMDEYLLPCGTRAVPEDNPFSFKAFIRNSFARRAAEKCGFKLDNWVLPDPSDVENIQRKIDQWGGVDIAFGGVGLNGHVAFNEAPTPSESWTEETFRQSSTRVLKISDVTKATNSIFGTGGDMKLLPDYAVTIGMKQMLEARAVHLVLDWPWQRNVFRRAILGPASMQFPVSMQTR